MNRKISMKATPIKNFIDEYKLHGADRLHMPGHKGAFGYGDDITEIHGVSSLYEEEGIIRESEEIAGSIFETGRTFYGTEGSSQVIKAMCYMALLYHRGINESFRNHECTIVASRNAHKAFIHASMLLGFNIAWLPTESDAYSLCECKVTPEGLNRFLVQYRSDHRDEEIVGVYITSPDYLGNILDIRGLSVIAHENDLLLMVDNAHGSYLKFMEEDMHPVSVGADMCSDSAHKTLPVLTGGAYLHISKTAPGELRSMGKKAMLMFGSTSPSFLILKSLDEANERLDVEGYRESASILSQLKKRLTLEGRLQRLGISLVGNEPLKLTFSFSDSCITGSWFMDELRKYNIECEYGGVDYVVTMWSPYMDCWKTADRLYDALWKILDEEYLRLNAGADIASGQKQERRGFISERSFNLPEVVYKPYETMFMPHKRVEVGMGIAGRIAADSVLECPPAVSPIVAGERITEEVIKVLEHLGTKYIDIISE